MTLDANTTQLLVFGLLAIVAAGLVVVSLIRELAPNQRRRWLLGIGLGTGVIAFSLKVSLIVLFSIFQQPILKTLPERETADRSRGEATARLFHASAIAPGRQWETLPETAPFPADNPPTPGKIALGKQLFFDPRLSADGSLSCASCHEISPAKGGADGLPTSVGINGQRGQRNAPTVLNAAFQRVLFWDGRAASLEEQARGPLTNPVEMGMPSMQSVVERVRGIAGYRQAFREAFQSEPAITADNIARALASFERTLITPDSPYDRFVKGELTALSEKQRRGMALFQETGCTHCHSGPNFSGASVFGNNTAFRIFPAIPDSEYEIRHRLHEDTGAIPAGTGADRGLWRIPSLRNVSRTAPYFHNGSVDTLEEAVRIMARVQLNKTLSNRSDDDRHVHWSDKDRQFSISSDQALSDTEISDIVAFLEALNGTLPARWYQPTNAIMRENPHAPHELTPGHTLIDRGT